jgi:hypothetical protein
VLADDELAGPVADEVDQPGDPQPLAGVVHEQDEHDDAGEHQDVAEQHRQAGDGAGVGAADLAEGQHRDQEARAEQADRELAPAVGEQGPHDAGRELAHRQLDRDQGDRQDERGQRHQGAGERGQDGLRVGRRTGQALRDEVVVRGPVHRERSDGEEGPCGQAGDRQQPQARTDEALEPHRVHARVAFGPAAGLDDSFPVMVSLPCGRIRWWGRGWAADLAERPVS